MTPRLANQPSIVLRVVHWLIFVEALYCYVVLGIAYSLGEGVPAALDVLMGDTGGLVDLMRRATQAAAARAGELAKIGEESPLESDGED